MDKQTYMKPDTTWVYSPAQYLQVLWQHQASILIILMSIVPMLEKCIHLLVYYLQVLSQYS